GGAESPTARGSDGRDALARSGVRWGGDEEPELLGKRGRFLVGAVLQDDARRVHVRPRELVARPVGELDRIREWRPPRGSLGVNRRAERTQHPSLAHDPEIEVRSEEHTSELQSRENLVCRLLLEKKN